MQILLVCVMVRVMLVMGIGWCKGASRPRVRLRSSLAGWFDLLIMTAFFGTLWLCLVTFNLVRIVLSIISTRFEARASRIW